MNSMSSVLSCGFERTPWRVAHYILTCSGVTCSAVSGIDVSVKPVCLHLWSCPCSITPSAAFALPHHHGLVTCSGQCYPTG
jgi:hypothetical protein